MKFLYNNSDGNNVLITTTKKKAIPLYFKAGAATVRGNFNIMVSIAYKSAYRESLKVIIDGINRVRNRGCSGGYIFR